MSGGRLDYSDFPDGVLGQGSSQVKALNLPAEHGYDWNHRQFPFCLSLNLAGIQISLQNKLIAIGTDFQSNPKLVLYGW